MSFQQIGFVETAQATARWAIKYHQQAVDGALWLRREGDDGEIADHPILQEWRSAKALLTRIRNAAAPFFANQAPRLGRAWVEVLGPLAGTAWTCEAGEYADSHLRTRICLIPSPGAVSLAGGASAALQVGWAHVYDPRLLASEVNFGEHARVHLVVDVRRPDPEA